MVLAVSSHTRSAQRWLELDLMRGLAGALMIANHSGVAWLGSERQGFNHVLTELGALAPVVFFAVTGFGRGIQGEGKVRPWRDVLTKVSVLFLADAALWMSPSHRAGLDFLAFIGIATLVVELVHRSRHPRFAAAACLLASVLLRFVIGPKLMPASDEYSLIGVRGALTGFALWGVGTRGLPGISYPLTPWIVFPLLGYLAGRAAAAHASMVRERRAALASGFLFIGAAGAGATLFLQHRGLGFFRWGSMTFAYFVFALTALCVSVSLVLFASGWLPGRWTARMTLPGVASLAVVPLHYLMVRVLRPDEHLSLPSPWHPLAVLCVLALSFHLSRRFEVFLPRASALLGDVRWLPLVAISFLLACSAVASDTSLRLGLQVVVQLLACVMFAQSSRSLPALNAAPTHSASVAG